VRSRLPKPVFPSRAEYLPQVDGQSVYRSPNIRYPQYQVPLMIYPGNRKSVRQRNTYRKKMERIRKWTELQGLIRSMLYHATKEEAFLSELLKPRAQHDQGSTEAGVREMKSMVYDLGRLMDYYELKEDILVEERLKEWLRLHPNSRFHPYGRRMTRRRRVALRAWEQEIRKIKRDRLALAEQNDFMRRWEDDWGKNTRVTLYRLPNQKKLKVIAKRCRRRKIGKYPL
jgi:hypothetical protein